jgi:hypothetical protein
MVNPARRNWQLVAAVAVMLLALIAVGRLQGRNLKAGDTGVPRSTKATVRTHDRPVASGLALAGRMELPGPAAAVAVGEGAVWVLLEQGTLLRVDPDRHQVTGRLDLEGATRRGPGGLAVGAGAVWVAIRDDTVTARIDPVRLRLTARFAGQVIVVADGVLWSYLVRGDKFMGFGRVDAGTLRPRRPLLVTDPAGRHPLLGGWFAVGNAAVWTAAFEDRRVWRVPLAGGPAHAVTRVPGHAYGLAADNGAVWVVSALAEPGSGADGSGRLRRLDRRTGAVSTITPLPDLDFSRDGVAIGLALGGGAVWLAGPSSRRSEASGVLLRVDQTSGQVTGWLRDPRWFFQDVLAAGPRGAWVATATPELLHVLAA